MQSTIYIISYCRLKPRADRIFQGALKLLFYDFPVMHDLVVQNIFVGRKSVAGSLMPTNYPCVIDLQVALNTTDSPAALYVCIMA